MIPSATINIHNVVGFKTCDRQSHSNGDGKFWYESVELYITSHEPFTDNGSIIVLQLFSDIEGGLEPIVRAFGTTAQVVNSKYDEDDDTDLPF